MLICCVSYLERRSPLVTAHRAIQIPACLTAATPDDCPEKRRMNAPCNPDHPGTFKVQEKPILLHVHPDVQNAMNCMIQADGVVMGCSTFGQIAGVFTRGISFFSTQCEGSVTPVQYRSIPPLAIAEMGYLWVPISGSWWNPVLKAPALLTGALEALLASKGSKATT